MALIAQAVSRWALERPERRAGSLETPGTPLNPTSLMAMLGARPTTSGAAVNADSALTLGAVWACVNVIAKQIAQLPLPLYQRRPGGRRGRTLATAHPLYDLLHNAPNPEMSSYTFRQTMQGHLLLRGNAVAEIDRDARTGTITALWPLHPDRVRRVRAKGQSVYVVHRPEGKDYGLNSTQVLHLRGLSPLGMEGYSPVALAREDIGLGLAAREYGARFFAQDARPGGVLRHPGLLSEDAAARLKASWEMAHSGLPNAHRVAILEEGLEFQAIGLTPEQAQMLQTRSATVVEVARLFGVPLFMIGEHTKDTSWGSGIEQQSIGFVIYTLAPWLVNWEQEIARSLLTLDERQAGYYPRHTVAGLLRGDAASRSAFYEAAIRSGWMTVDEVRELEELNPYPDGAGARPLVQANWTYLDQLDAPPPAPPALPPAPPPTAPTPARRPARRPQEGGA